VHEITAEVIATIDQFDQLKAEWQSLFERCGEARISMSYEWHRTWWTHFGRERGPAPGGLRICTFRRGKELIGVLPLFLETKTKRLGFLTSGGHPGASACPEYLDILTLPEDAPSCLQEFTKLLEHPLLQRGWITLEIGFVATDSHVATYLATEIAPLRATWRRERKLPAPRADLAGGLTAYLSRCGGSQKLFRRLLNQEKRYPISLKVVTTEADLVTTLPLLFKLHQKTWQTRGHSGAFASSTIKSFHTDLTKQLQRKNRLFLATLYSEETPLVVIYGFIRATSFELYQLGMVDPKDTTLKSPGILCHLMCMRYLSEHGITLYDFLGGDEDYKKRFATVTAILLERQFIRPSIPTMLTLAKGAMRRGFSFVPRPSLRRIK
jgi:CelD/BcsL family acetyltransferase involved in cellulose biosynthesis